MARGNSPHDRPSLHLAISEALREQIAAGQYLSGEQLPSEHQLMEQFGVSRITVRQAISNLISQGLVIPRQGKGVFVAEQRKAIYPLSNPLRLWDDTMTQQSMNWSIQNLVFELLAAPQEVQRLLRLTQRKPQVYLQKKLIQIDGTPAAVDVNYILPKLGKLYATELESRMTFPTLESNGVEIERIEAILESTHATAELGSYLDVPLGNPLIVCRYTGYTTKNRPIVVGETLSRGDRLCYSVVLTKQASA